MSRRRTGAPLGERSLGRTGPAAHGRPDGAPDAGLSAALNAELDVRPAARRSGGDPGGPQDGRHCWVLDAPGHPGRWPGLLLEWRRDPGGWQGRVAYALPEVGDRASRLIERWVAADRLEPADEEGPRGTSR